MAELTSVALQTVQANQNVLFTEVPVESGKCGSILHRVGSGLITLRGRTNQCRAMFKVTFGANVAVPTGGTVGPLSLALSINGEPINSTIMISTPAAVGAFNNVASSVLIAVPADCCLQVSVKNISADNAPIDVQNANLIIERIA